MSIRFTAGTMMPKTYDRGSPYYRLKPFLRPTGSVTPTKHRNAAPLRSNCESHFDPRRLRGLTGCYVALSRLVMPMLMLFGIFSCAVAENVMEIDRDRINQIALDAVLIDNPDLMPGDLVRKGDRFLIFCSESKGACFATVTFKVISTLATSRFKDDDGVCWEKETGEAIDVQVWDNGSYTIRDGGGGGGKSTINCNLVESAT